MGQDPSSIRAEIEETRSRVGNEVDALSYKTDVSARVGDYVDEKKQAVKDKVTGAKDAVTGTASRAIPSGEKVGRVKDTAERNPLGLAVGAAAIGFVAGLVLPATRVENERMGEMSDRLVEAAKETAGDAVERGKQVAQDAAETAKESGRQQGQELATNLQERAQETSGSSHSVARSGVLRHPGGASVGAPPGCPELSANDVCGSAAADRRDHVDARACLERGVQAGALAVDVHVDVLTERRARLAQAVAKARPLLLETVERFSDGARVDFEAAREAGEEGRERRR